MWSWFSDIPARCIRNYMQTTASRTAFMHMQTVVMIRYSAGDVMHARAILQIAYAYTVFFRFLAKIKALT